MQKKYTYVTEKWRQKMSRVMHRHFGDPEERFWNKVAIRGANQCWPWMGWLDKRGYGGAWFRKQHRPRGAHRIAYYFTYGHLPNLHICHKCDNPRCCNPMHLFAATNHENILDAVKKGRMCMGEDRPQSKLTSKQVSQIRKMYSNGNVSQYAIAKRFHVSRTAIEHIVLRRCWKHIP